MGDLLRRLARDQRGTNTVELAFISISLLLHTLGAVDIGRIGLDWNAAQKAAQLGAREAVIRDPVVVPLKFHFACNTLSDTALVGTPCAQDSTGACDFGPYTCTSAGCTGDGGVQYGYGTDKASQETFDAIVAAMKSGLPGLQPENVQIIYSPTDLGFIGMPQAPPTLVDVRVTGVQWEFVGLAPFGALLPDAINMPTMHSTLTGEDYSNNSCGEQGLRSVIQGDGSIVCSTQGKADDPPTQVCFN